MKRIIVLALMLCAAVTACYSQKIPQDIQSELTRIKSNFQLKLDSCRTNRNIGNWGGGRLSAYFHSYKLIKQVDSLGLVLTWDLIYDNAMRKRMLDLLQNKYRKDEFDTLVNRHMRMRSQYGFEQSAMLAMSNTKRFRYVEDSLRKNRNREEHPEPYQYDEVFFYLKMDTLPRFHFLIDSIKKATKIEIEQNYKNNIHFDLRRLVRACGYVNDKRFVQPLIELLKKPELIDSTEVIDALVRMKIEPYRTNFLKKNTIPEIELRENEYSGELQELRAFADNQDFLLQISKYLLSKSYSSFSPEGPFGEAYWDAYKTITKYITNEDLWAIINSPDFKLEEEESRLIIYDWMQANYGKYIIKRIW